MSAYTRWYRDGTVAVTKGSNTVAGTNTYWLTAGLNPGDILKVDGVDYEIVSITDNTNLTIAGSYEGTTDSDKSYAIVRNFTASTSARMAAQTAELLGDFSKYIDNDMQSIHGKSAYQIACDKGYVGTESEWVQSLKGDSAYQVAAANGYSGTESEWLESLKADNEWSTLNERTQPLLWNWKNSIYRGQSLGSTYDNDQLFTDARLGDYYTMNGKKLTIAGFNYLIGGQTVTFIYNSGGARNSSDQDATIPYGNSYWFTNTIPALVTELEAFFGDRLQSYSILAPAAFSANVDFAVPSSWAALSSKAHLITLSMITGYSTAAIKHAMSWSNGGVPPRFYYPQLPLYRMTNAGTNITAVELEMSKQIFVIYGHTTFYDTPKTNVGTVKPVVFHVKKTLNS